MAKGKYKTYKDIVQEDLEQLQESQENLLIRQGGIEEELKTIEENIQEALTAVQSNLDLITTVTVMALVNLFAIFAIIVYLSRL